MEIVSPSHSKDPHFVTGEIEKKYYDFDCEICKTQLQIDFQKQINNSWKGKTRLIDEEELASLRERFNIGLINKSHEGGLPVFDKVICSKCDSEYYTYSGVTEFSNSAYAVQIQSIFLDIERDEITRVEIDSENRLVLKPKSVRFTLIYRTATGVHWNLDEQTLYSTIPRDMSHLDWYNHIVDVVKKECSCELYLTQQTEWVNVSPELKVQITGKQTKYNKR